MKFIACALAGAILFAGGGAAFAQGTINDYVRELVVNSADPSEDILAAEIVLGEIDELGIHEVTFRIDPDKIYHVYAACDDDCDDIDLAAYNSDGDELQNDYADDAEPMLLILPGLSDDLLTIELEMSLCNTDTCVFGIGLYEVKD